MALVYDTHVPPEKVSAKVLEKADWRVEYELITALRDMGQDVHVLGVGDDLAPIQDAILSFDPHVALNQIEELHNERIYDHNLVSYLEILQVPYTGCNSRGLVISRDKAMVKKLLSFHSLCVPQFAVFPRQRAVSRPKHLSFPLIVKPLAEQASAGISQSSIVYDDDKLRERVAFIHESVGADAIAESYIEGREIYVGVMGNQRLEAFPVWELQFKKAPDAIHKIATQRAKWDANYIRKMGISLGEARDLSKSETDRIHEICKKAYRILGLSGYARMDLRLAPDGTVYFIEANPNPHIGRGEAFADSAAKAGLSYEELLWRILNLGMNWQTGQLQVA